MPIPAAVFITINDNISVTTNWCTLGKRGY